MSSIINNVNRIGNFTSSNIFKLMTNGKSAGSLGKPALEYVAECNMERRLQRSLTTESNARPLVWGKSVEYIVFNKLSAEYYPVSDETITHKTMTYWSGSPDMVKPSESVVVDCKCPITLKSFCELVDSETIENIRDNHKDGDKYFWQLVSNAILTDSNFAELIVYCPYKSELEMIREESVDYFIVKGTDDDLPWLHDGGHYKNLNIIRFEVKQSDKDSLTARVLEAGKYLINQ